MQNFTVKKGAMLVAFTSGLSNLMYGGDYHLDMVAVEGKVESEIVKDTISKKSSTLSKAARGETLGDYLANEQFVSSTSYGPAVGRPVVRGMSGYRVGIANGNIALNDLSAMSDDHAVGMMPRASRNIELVRGPSSLLYGSYTGGVIRSISEEHNREFLKEEVRGELSGGGGTNGVGALGAISAEAAQDNFSVSIDGAYHDADAYKDGNGNTVQNSDTLSKQIHTVLGYKLSDENNLKLYYDTMDKKYGIAEGGPDRVYIDMNQERYGLVWNNKNLFDFFEYAQSEISYSDYQHTELSGVTPGGLFGQKQLNVSTLLGVDFDAWHLDTNIEFMNSEVKTCRDEGVGCFGFGSASRSPNVVNGNVLLSNLNTFGQPYAETNPMPNIDEKLLKAGMVLKNFLNDSNEITLAVRTDLRKLSSDSKNIAQEFLVPNSLDANYYDSINDAAFSASVGVYSFITKELTMQTSLSYIERLPSAQELFWNGVHESTGSYVIGDKNLKNEQSINLDFNLVYNKGAFTTEASFFYNNFANYIFQAPVDDNGAMNTIFGEDFFVWKMQGTGARVYGAGIKESYLEEFGAHKIGASLAFEALRGELKNGRYIARMPPYSATATLTHAYKGFSSTVSYKRVDRSRFEGFGETRTASYGWLSAYMEYALKIKSLDASLFLKGENLTDTQAQNHLSFLKDTAPYADCQISAGATLHF